MPSIDQIRLTHPRVRRAIGGRRAMSAYGALNVSPTAVLEAPKATPFLLKIGGLPVAIDALRASPAPEARAIMAIYDDPALLPSHRAILPFEAFCVAAKVCPSRAVDVIVAAIARIRVLEGAVISATKHPAVMETNARIAATDDGIKDRMAHLKMVGAMPLPKSSQTVVTVNATATAQAAAKADSPALASPEDTIRRIVERRQQAAATLAASTQRELPAAPSSAIPQAFMPRAAVREPVTVEQEYMDADADAAAAGDD